jgi:hypothetical protein
MNIAQFKEIDKSNRIKLVAYVSYYSRGDDLAEYSLFLMMNPSKDRTDTARIVWNRMKAGGMDDGITHFITGHKRKLPRFIHVQSSQFYNLNKGNAETLF